MKKKRVVVTGMGVVSSLGMDVDGFYESLLQGKSGIRPISLFPCEEFPTRFAGEVADFNFEGYIDKKQGRRVDPFIRYTMVSGKKALEMAGIDPVNPQGLDLSRCGIIIGSGMGGMNVYSEGNTTLITKGFKRITPFFVPYIITNMGGALLAIDVGFMGPNYSISTACATGAYSIVSSADHIRKGDADLMICGGAEAAITPIGLGGFVACKALSERNDHPEKASRPWDKNRDGFVMGEGAGVIVLESLEHALARGAPILAEYLGGAITCDAHHMTDPKPDGSGVALCMKRALEGAGIQASEVDYINAHATSTLTGDMCEIRGIKSVFGAHSAKIKINATKSMIGHTLGAAGGIEAVVTIKAILTGKLHPTINLDDPDEELEGLDVVGKDAVSHRVKVGMSNSFGFGGHNSTIIFAPFHH